MYNIIHMDVKVIRQLIHTLPISALAQLKQEFDKYPTHEKVLLVKDELEKRLA